MKVSIELQRLCFSGTYVRYKVYTPGSGPVTRRACFVSSPVGDAECWDALCRILASQGCLCVAFELPGFGHTPVRAPQDNPTRAAILWGVLDEVEISRGEEPGFWHLVSHGSGCGVILEMALSHPESVLSRTLISPVTHRFEKGIKRMLYSTRFGRWLCATAYKRAESRFGEKLLNLYGEPLDDARRSRLTREFCREGRLETLFALFKDGYRHSRGAFSVEGPIMLIWGKNDSFGPRPDDKLLHALSEVEVHYITGYHMCMETLPQETSEYLNGWFDHVEGRAKEPAFPG